MQAAGKYQLTAHFPDSEYVRDRKATLTARFKIHGSMEQLRFSSVCSMLTEEP